MHLLIVDDERSMIEALNANLKWDTLPFETVRSATSQQEAMQLLQMQPADVLLCDVEMPSGSGLDLVSWVRQKFPMTCNILLTSHADFSYAQRAVQLGSFDYVLKPVQFDKLTLLLQQAASQVVQQQKLAQAGLYWEEGKKSVEQQFWQDLFFGEIHPNAESIARYLTQKHLSIAPDGVYLPVLFCPHVEEDLTSRDQNLLLYAIRNIAEELLHSPAWKISVHPFAKQLVLAIVQTESPLDKQATDALWTRCDQLLHTLDATLHHNVYCYIGECGSLVTLPNQLEGMQEADFNNVIATSRITWMQQYSAAPVPYQNDSFTDWELLLENGAFERVRNEIHVYLMHLAANGQCNRNVLGKFYNDFYCLLYNNANRDHVFLNTLYGDNASVQLSSAAQQTVQALASWVCHALNCLEKFRHQNMAARSPVSRVCHYIQEHLEEDIAVEQLAETAHLNADYLNRIFKKETGTSLNQYVIQQKMEKAKWLLLNTNDTIATIAAKVGYYNYSSFNRVFIKTVGCAPRDWKMSHLSR